MRKLFWNIYFESNWYQLMAIMFIFKRDMFNAVRENYKLVKAEAIRVAWKQVETKSFKTRVKEGFEAFTQLMTWKF